MQKLKSTKKVSRKKSGFTLIEALIAISILMIALASPLTLAQKGIAAAELSKDQMTASFLAQDGIEAVKNIRDQTAVSAPSDGSVTNWLSGLGSCVCSDTTLNCSTFAAGVGYCNIDTTAQNLTAAGVIVPGTNQSSNPLRMTSDAVTGAFVKYDLSTPGANSVNSKFSRYINIRQSTTNPNEAAVNVRVSWVSQIGVQNITIQDFIYNYSENIQ